MEELKLFLFFFFNFFFINMNVKDAIENRRAYLSLETLERTKEIHQK